MHDPQHPPAAPGVPGYNKQLRDRSKYALAATAFLMLSGSSHLACIPSAYSIYNLKAGTALSGKNAKWMLLSIMSFCVGLSCAVLDGGARIVDGDRDYNFQAKLRFWSFALRTFTWPILMLFLVCTWGYFWENGVPDNHQATTKLVQKAQ